MITVWLLSFIPCGPHCHAFFYHLSLVPISKFPLHTFSSVIIPSVFLIQQPDHITKWSISLRYTCTHFLDLLSIMNKIIYPKSLYPLYLWISRHISEGHFYIAIILRQLLCMEISRMSIGKGKIPSRGHY